MFRKVANCAGGCPTTLGPQMAHQVADSDWEHVHCSRSPAPASGTAGNCFLRVQAPGERSFSVPAVTHIPPGAHFPPPLIIPGGLVLCSWIKPRQLSLTPAKLHTEPGPLLRFVSGENLMCFRQVPRQVRTEQRFAECRDNRGLARGARQGFCWATFPCLEEKGSLTEALLLLSLKDPRCGETFTTFSPPPPYPLRL